jgi:hypothetical protein
MCPERTVPKWRATADEDGHLLCHGAMTQRPPKRSGRITCDGLRADSDDLARVYRFDVAQDSEMISPTIPILMSPGA